MNAWWDYTATSEIFYANTGTSGDTQTPYALCVPIATTTAGNSDQNFTYPVKNDGYVKDDAVSATRFCTEK